MKKLFFLGFLFSLFPILGFTQTFDDLPYSSPDRWTYFQQEMTSLMRYQAEDNDTGTLFFSSMSVRYSTLKYKEDYISSLYGKYIDEDRFKGSEDLNLLLGVQVKVVNWLYLSSFMHLGSATSYIQLEEYEYNSYGVERKGPAYVENTKLSYFSGTGAFFNTDVLKGGVYLGLDTFIKNYQKMDVFLSSASYDSDDIVFKIALVPLINTSGFAYVGKVLSNVLGYLGLGDNIANSAAAQDDPKIQALASSLNAALDFTFNRIDLGSLTLHPQLMYTRGSFDAAAKTDTYGIKVQGLFSNIPLGFTFEGGYKHFFSVSKFFLSEYSDTGYFNGTIFYRFKLSDLGIIYHYDNIYKSKITFVWSFFPPLSDSGSRLSAYDTIWHWSINPSRQYMDREKLQPYLSFDLGSRSRLGLRRGRKN